MLEDSILRGLRTRPAIRTAFVLSAGILMGDQTDLPSSVWYAALLLSVSLRLLLRYVLCRSSPNQVTFAEDVLMTVSLAFLACVLLASSREERGSLVLHPTSQEHSIRVWGSVLTPSSPVRNGFTLTVRSDSIISGSIVYREPRDVRVLLRTSSVVRPPKSGSSVHVSGWLERFPRPRNPGDSDYGFALSAMGISAVVRAESLTTLNDAVDFNPSLFVGTLQELLYGWIDSLHTGEHRAFLKGIVLGYRADLPDDLRQAFTETGTVHILAVSGSNVALLALVVMVCTGLLRLPVVARAGVTLVILGAYMLVTGGGPSIARATVMGSVVVIMTLVPRRSDVFQSLGVAATILLLLDPNSLFDIGFQLSFASVIWIVVGGPVIDRWRKLLPEEFAESAFLLIVIQLAGITLMAQLGTLPISAAAFGRVSVISVVVNLAVVPLSAVVLLLGVTELALMTVLPMFAEIYAEGNAVVMEFLVNAVRLAARFPYSSVNVGVSGWTEALMMYAVIVGLVWWFNRDVRTLAMVTTLGCLTAMIWSDALDNKVGRLDWLSVDVGQGDAHILRTPSGKVILLDAGPSEQEARRSILPLLERLNVHELEAVVLSHPHGDHMGGLPLLLDRLSVSTLVLTDSVHLRRSVDSIVRQQGVRILRLRAGSIYRPDSTIRVYILHPVRVDPGGGWNNNSLVVKVVYGRTSILSTGDAEVEAEAELDHRWGPFLATDLVKLGHHGSETSSSEPFLRRTRPRYAIVSAGFRNKFHHPSPRRVEALRAAGTEVYQTMWEGALWFQSDGTSVRRLQWRPDAQSPVKDSTLRGDSYGSVWEDRKLNQQLQSR